MASRARHPRLTRGSGRRRGAILLEALLALTLFLTAAALVGGAVRAGLAAADRIGQRTRALALAESLLAEIRADYLVAEDGAESDFAPQFPEYRYQLAVEETPDLPAVRHITVTVSWDVPADVGQAPRTDSVQLVGWQFYKEPEEVPAEPETATDQGQPTDGSFTGGSTSGGATGGTTGAGTTGGGQNRTGTGGRTGGGQP